MTREQLVGQLIDLKQTFAPTGDSDDELERHFNAELNRNEIVWFEQDGKVIAFADFSMIASEADVEKAERGERTEGDILFILNAVCLEPGLLWELKRHAPPHSKMIWRGKDRLIHPRRFHEQFV